MMKDMKKLDSKSIGILLVAGGAAILLLILFMAGSQKKEEAPSENRMAEIMADVPDAEEHAIPESKTAAYESTDSRKSNMDSYWDSCEEVYEEKELEEQKRQDGTGTVTGGGAATPEKLFSQQTAAPVQKPRDDYSNPYRETPEEREERHRRSREEAFRLAQEMNGTEDTATQENVRDLDDTVQRITTETAVVKRSSIISSLDDGWDSDGISSLDSDDEFLKEEQLHPFKCMFAKDSKIKNGQRVSVILLEDIVVSGTLVPKNTHIMASCRLAGRLELELTNIEIGGRILSLGYEAYDVDGNKGIYCPDVSSTGRQARSTGRSILGSRLSGLMGGLARDVVNTGVSIIQSKDGETTVTVPAGYTFFIVKKKNNF